MDAMLFENVCWDQRQVVNGLFEFGGYVSCSVGYEADSGDGGRNLQRAIGRTGFLQSQWPRNADGLIYKPLAR